MRLVLASASPRRLDLLARIGVDARRGRFPPISTRRRPTASCRRLCPPHGAEKAAAVHAIEPGALVLAADTVVAVGRRILPKAETEPRRARRSPCSRAAATASFRRSP